MLSFLEIILVGANRMDDMGLRTRKEQRWGGWVGDSSLKELYIKDYIGERFPSWMMNDGFGSLLPNLVKIMMKRCKRFRVLPLFGQLPSLQYLELECCMENMKSYSSSATPFFPSLKTLRLERLPHLMEWGKRDVAAEQAPSFPCLSKLKIKVCWPALNWCPWHCLHLLLVFLF